MDNKEIERLLGEFNINVELVVGLKKAIEMYLHDKQISLLDISVGMSYCCNYILGFALQDLPSNTKMDAIEQFGSSLLMGIEILKEEIKNEKMH